MNILLLTSDYPFGIGEQFIGPELEVLVRMCESVQIVPLNYGRNSASPRAVPAGCTVRLDIAPEVFRIFDEKKKAGCMPFLCQEGLSDMYDFLANVRRDKWKNRKVIVEWSMFAHSIVEALEENMPLDQIDVAYSYWSVQSALALSILKKTRPYLVTVSRAHGYDIYAERQAKNHLPYYKEMLRDIDAVFPCSDAARSYLSKKYPDGTDKIHPMHLGIHSAPVADQSRDGILRIVSCSRLIPLKRVDAIADAIGRCKRRIDWMHMGDGSCRAEIERCIAHMPSNVRCRLTGHLDHASLLAIYRENPVDVFVNFSTSEGIPVSMMEAMARGIPCIAPAVGGIPELLDHGSGWLLPKEATIDQLAALIDSTDFSNVSIREAARAKQQSCFSAEKNYRAFFEKLVTIRSGVKRQSEVFAGDAPNPYSAPTENHI